MFTNIASYGGKFLRVVDEKMKSSTDVVIASGYVSLDILSKFRQYFVKIAENGGSSRLLVGMAFYEGLSKGVLEFLQILAAELESKNNSSGVFVPYSGKFHGKIYKFSNSHCDDIYIGSSNFSASGLISNIEATTLVTNSELTQKTNEFLKFLFSKETSVSILKADITVLGSAKYNERVQIDILDDLDRYKPDTIDLTLLPFFDYSLSRVVGNEKSNLNVYFGRGRWSKRTGIVTPRHWYEIELIADSSLYRNPLYPRGNFLAYTDDGYIIPMKTGGDNFKNIRSQGNLQLLGQWIKRKLQNAKALIPLTPVTQDVLDQYGNDVVRFYKIDDEKYFMSF